MKAVDVLPLPATKPGRAEIEARTPEAATRDRSRRFLQALARRADVSPGAPVVVMGNGDLARFRSDVHPDELVEVVR